MPKPIQSVLTFGSTGIVVDVECQLSNGLPGITIVGLGNKAVDEARERVRSAFSSAKLSMPRKRITINLAPADIQKESTSLDIAIALAILQADGQLKYTASDSAVIGELGLNGDVRAVRGIIGKLLWGKRQRLNCFFIPKANLKQARLIPGLTLVPVANLQELIRALVAGQYDKVLSSDGHALPTTAPTTEHSLADVAGQEQAKRGLEIAAAGGHNILLNGPPGTGKSMLARTLPSLLPPLGREEMLETTQIHSLVSGNYEELITERPFRTPHHSASHVAIVGGGNTLRPGEVSLAHRGVLFLDELPEFTRHTVEALRQPLEDRCITVSRAKDTVLYPASFILVATSNPCPCGFYGTGGRCECPAGAIVKYRHKLSGPILDRIDLFTDVEQVEHAKLLKATDASDDTVIRQRILEARTRQARRYGSATKLNADMTNSDIKKKSEITDAALELLNSAATSLALSARSYMRVIKVARTIADLDESTRLEARHITEALRYRRQNSELLV